MHVRRFMGAYLITTALLGKFKAWNASWAARHPNIFWMFAVRHSKAIGLTLSQALLCTSAMHVVQPDMAWNDREQGWKMNADGFLVTFKFKVVKHPGVCWNRSLNSINQGKCCLIVEGMCFYIFLHTHMEMCLFSHITCPLLSAKTCLAQVILKRIKCCSWLFWIILAENHKTTLMEIANSVLQGVFWASSSSLFARDRGHPLGQTWPLLQEKRTRVSLKFKAAVSKRSPSPASCR